MSTRRAIGIGAVVGLIPGVLLSLFTDFPLGPEAGLLVGAGAGWLYQRKLS